MDLFHKAFPNIERIKSRAKFKTFLRTDGVACSVVYERKVCGTRASRKEALCASERSDLESPSPPLAPREGQRLIGVDPGRRDMIVAVEHNSGEVLKMSTRTHVHECGRAKAKRLTLKTLRTVVIPSTGLNLVQTLSKSPSGKEIQKTHWELYLSFILPLVDVRAEAYRRRAIRRVRFENFMKRDKSLDTLCNRLCALGRGTRDQTVLIAFGDGSHCSTGFGQQKASPFAFSEGKCCSCAAAPVSETTRTDTRSARDVDSRGVHEPEMFSVLLSTRGVEEYHHLKERTRRSSGGSPRRRLLSHDALRACQGGSRRTRLSFLSRKRRPSSILASGRECRSEHDRHLSELGNK